MRVSLLCAFVLFCAVCTLTVSAAAARPSAVPTRVARAAAGNVNHKNRPAAAGGPSSAHVAAAAGEKQRRSEELKWSVHTLFQLTFTALTVHCPQHTSVTVSSSGGVDTR